MAEEGKEFKTEISADPAGFITGMQKAQAAAASGADAIKSSVEKMGSAFANFQKPLMAIAALFAGGAFFKEAIGAANQLTGESMSLARTLGITGTQAATLRTALQDIGSDSDTYIGAFQKFAKQIKNNEAGLEAMGLKTRDANGDLRDSNTLFTEALHVVGEYKPGLDQTTAAMTLFGKGVNEVMALQKLNTKVIEDAKQKNQDLHLNLTQEGVEATKTYRRAMTGMSEVFLGIKNVIGQAVMPVFTQLAEMFNGIGPTAVFVFKVAIDTLATALQAVILVIKTLWNVLRAIADPLFTIGGAIKKLISGDITGATNDMMKLGKNWGDAMAGAFDKIAADGKRTWTEVQNLWGKGTEVGVPGKGTKTMGDFGKTNGGKAGKADVSRMGGWEAELADLKVGIERKGLAEGQYREMSKAAELKFWADRKGMAGLSSTERIALTRKTAETELAMIKQGFEVTVATLQAEAAAYQHNTEERMRLELAIQSKYQAGTKEYEAAAKKIVEIQRQAAEQERAIRESRVQAARAAQLQTITLEEQTLQTAAQLGLVTHGQVLEAQQQFELRRNAVANEALQQRLQDALTDPDRNPVLVEKINSELEALEQQHQIRLGQLRSQTMVESQRDVTSTLGAIQSSWAGLISQLMKGTLTIGGFIKGMFQSVANAVIDTLAQLAAKWLVNLILQRVTSKGAAAAQIADNAAVAGAAATASAAAIPFVGWAMAPEAGAAVYGSAISYMAGLASAAGGYDIPGNINPIVQTHAREMILPAKHADVIRSLADNGGAPGGGGGGGAMELHVHAVDAQSVQRLFRDNGDALVKVMREQRRNFAF